MRDPYMDAGWCHVCLNEGTIEDPGSTGTRPCPGYVDPVTGETYECLAAAWKREHESCAS